MTTAEALWKENLQRLGEFIRSQRRIHELSQRELAKLSDLSDTYMSQLERGLHEPSLRVLMSIAQSLRIKPDELIMFAAGLAYDQSEGDPPVVPGSRTEDAIRADHRLSDAQKHALLAVVASYIEANRA